MSLLPPHPLQFLIPSNLLIEFLLHLVDEIGTAGILAQFDGRVVAVALLGVKPEELVEGRGEHLQGCLSVVNATHLAQPVNQFHEEWMLDVSGGTWGVVRNFCIFLTKESAFPI